MVREADGKGKNRDTEVNSLEDGVPELEPEDWHEQ
jgi:hypothetical protein